MPGTLYLVPTPIGNLGDVSERARQTLERVLDGIYLDAGVALDFDIGAVNGLLSPFLSAGFYYKTFMWPA